MGLSCASIQGHAIAAMEQLGPGHALQIDERDLEHFDRLDDLEARLQSAERLKRQLSRYSCKMSRKGQIVTGPGKEPMFYTPVPNDIHVTQSDVLLSIGHEERYCGDLNCACHTDVKYHSQVTSIQEYSGEEVRKAYRAFGIRQ